MAIGLSGRNYDLKVQGTGGADLVAALPGVAEEGKQGRVRFLRAGAFGMSTASAVLVSIPLDAPDEEVADLLAAIGEAAEQEGWKLADGEGACPEKDADTLWGRFVHEREKYEEMAADGRGLGLPETFQLAKPWYQKWTVILAAIALLALFLIAGSCDAVKSFIDFQ